MAAKPNKRRPFPLVVDEPVACRRAEGVAPWLRSAVAGRPDLPDGVLAWRLGVQTQHVRMMRDELELEGDAAA